MHLQAQRCLHGFFESLARDGGAGGAVHAVDFFGGGKSHEFSRHLLDGPGTNAFGLGVLAHLDGGDFAVGVQCHGDGNLAAHALGRARECAVGVGRGARCAGVGRQVRLITQTGRGAGGLLEGFSDELPRLGGCMCAHAVFCSEGDKSFPLSGDVWVPVLARMGKEAQTRGMRIVGSGFICRSVVAGGLRYVFVCPPVRHGGIARRALARLRVPC